MCSLPGEIWFIIMVKTENFKNLLRTCKGLRDLVSQELREFKYHKARSFIRRNALYREWNIVSEYLALYKHIGSSSWRFHPYLRDATYWLLGHIANPSTCLIDVENDITLQDQISWRREIPREVSVFQGLDLGAMTYEEMYNMLLKSETPEHDTILALSLGFTYGLKRDLTSDIIYDTSTSFSESWHHGYALGVALNPSISDEDVLFFSSEGPEICSYPEELLRRPGLARIAFAEDAPWHYPRGYASNGILDREVFEEIVRRSKDDPDYIDRVVDNPTLTWDILKPHADLFDGYWAKLLMFVDVDYNTWVSKIQRINDKTGYILAAILNPRLTFEQTNSIISYIKSSN